MDSASAEDAGADVDTSEPDDGAVESRTPPSRLKLLLITAGILLAFDQLTKWLIDRNMDPGDKVDLFWKLRLNYVLNEGASFSFGSGLGPIIGVIAFLVGFGIIFVGRRVHATALAVTLGCILGGVWGNFLDRLLRSDDGFLGGAVIDFVDVQFWPVWNVADMGIVLGGIAMLFQVASLEENGL